jgi:DNA-3-methyladenine glycosylase II
VTRRAEGRTSALHVPEGASARPLPTHFDLAALPPFRLDLTVWALRRRPGNSVDRWDGRTYARSASLAGALAELAVTQVQSGDSPRLEVAVTADRPVARDRLQVEVGEFLRHTLGLEVDLGDFYRHATRDPRLRELADRFRGLKPPRFPTLFECLANAIACQQLTLTVGIELLNRLAATYGRPAPGARPSANAFPRPHDLAGLEPDALRALGFSGQKSRALLELANRVEHGALRAEHIGELSDGAASDALQDLRGVGRWSAEYGLLRGLGRLDVFPGDDVGARNNLTRWLGGAAPLDYEEVRSITSRWAPYRGLVYFHLLLDRVDESGWLEREDASNVAKP